MRIRLITAVLLIVLAGCGPSAASPSPVASGGANPSGSPSASLSAADVDAIYAEIRSQVEAIRGLKPTSDVPPVTIDATQLQTNLSADFDAENPPAQVALSQRTLTALGLLPAGSSLRSIVLALQSGQVAGYYSPPHKQLFVVSRSGGVGAVERVTYAHEFTHELQDQHFDLQALGLDARDQGDRSLARLALVEGDAVSSQATWMTQELDAADLSDLIGAATDPAAVAAIKNAPAYIQQTSLFPYNDGLAFVQELRQTGGYDAVNAAFARPPDSTEQILHEDKYVAGEKPIAVAIAADLPARLGAGWTADAQDTLGELVLRVWLEQGGVPRSDAAAAAAGWGGDRLALLRGPNGDAVALETAWDTPDDADAFATAATQALGGLGLRGQVVHATGSAHVSIAIGAASASLAALLPD
jgi:hypothetical protein